VIVEEAEEELGGVLEGAVRLRRPHRRDERHDERAAEILPEAVAVEEFPQRLGGPADA